MRRFWGRRPAAALSLARSVHAAGSDVIKVGLIGCGGRGSGAAANAMNAGKDVHVVAMADVFAERIETARPQLKDRSTPTSSWWTTRHAFVGFDAYQKVIQSGVDVVVIACTSHFHPVFLKAAVDAGKHVFVEKPVAVDPAGVRIAMAASEEAKKKNLSVVSGFCWRYDDGVRETIQRIRDGAIGEIVAVQATRLGGSVRPPHRGSPTGTKCSTSSRTGITSTGSPAATPCRTWSTRSTTPRGCWTTLRRPRPGAWAGGRFAPTPTSTATNWTITRSSTSMPTGSGSSPTAATSPAATTRPR